MKVTAGLADDATEPLRFATPPGFHGPVGELIDRMFNPALTLDDVDWLRSEWPGSLVIKGVQNPADAKAIIAYLKSVPRNQSPN